MRVDPQPTWSAIALSSAPALAGEPDASNGLAVMCDEASLRGVARIPLCGCGERGCGNAGVQLVTDLDVTALPALIDAVSPSARCVRNPHRGSTWDGKIVDGQAVVG